MAEVSAGRRSYRAMLLSVVMPGLGQLYLRKQLKGFILFLGVASAAALIYIHSLPVNSWRDLTRLDLFDKSPDERQAKKQAEVSSEVHEPAAENREQKRWRSYPLHTSDRKFLFRMGAEFQKDLVDSKGLSESLRQEFRNHKVLVYKDAKISTKKEGSWWLIADNYQTYSVKKDEYGLSIYSTAQWRFRPRWQFKISGLIQMALFWGYAIFDGWLGRRGFNRQA